MNFLPYDLGYLIGLGVVVGALAELYCRYVLAMQRKGNALFGDHLLLRRQRRGGIHHGWMGSVRRHTFMTTRPREHSKKESKTCDEE